MQAIGRRQHRLKFGPADFVDQVQSNQGGSRSAALVSGLLGRIGNGVHHAIGLRAPDQPFEGRLRDAVNGAYGARPFAYEAETRKP